MSGTAENSGISSLFRCVEHAAGLDDPLAREILEIAESARVAPGPQLDFLTVLLTRASIVTLRHCVERGSGATRQSLEQMLPAELLKEIV